MVKRTALFRKALGSLGIMLLLLSSSSDALGLHRCAHHDALPSASPAEAQHDHHKHDSAPADQESSSGCTCVGTCATTVVALVPSSKVSLVEVAPATFVVQRSAPAIIVPAAPDFLLPFSTAPPASL